MSIAGGSNSTLMRNMFNVLRDQIDPTILAISTPVFVVPTRLLVLAQIYDRDRTDRPTLPVRRLRPRSTRCGVLRINGRLKRRGQSEAPSVQVQERP